MNTRLLLLVFSLFIHNVLKAQDLPNLAPLTPNAAAIAKYGEMPPGNFSGIPNINIPLYSIESSELKLPLSLSYHSGGNKVTSVASWVGLGWSLNSIPTILRTIKGVADEKKLLVNRPPEETLNKMVLSNFDDQNLVGQNFRRGLYQNPYSYDSSPDIFYYNLPTESGRFMYSEFQKKFLTIPHTNTKISYERFEEPLGEGTYITFKLVTEKGEEYIFDIRETSLLEGDKNTSAWKVSKILSATKRDSISFEYQDEKYDDIALGEGFKYEVRDAISSTGGNAGPHYPENFNWGHQTYGFTTIKAKVVSRITFNNGFVEFERNTIKREDINASPVKGAYSLKNINVYNKNNKYIKGYQFNYKYLTGSATGNSISDPCFVDEMNSNKWMLLTSLEESPSVSTKKLTHYFSYNEEYTPPCRYSLGQDYLGYYNGADTNEELVPTVTVYDYINDRDKVVEGADRQVDPAKCKFAILKRIIYPTGGYTEYDFESNMVSSQDLPSDFVKDSHENSYVGGLRVKEIRNYDKGASTPITYKYKYTTDYNSNVSSGDVFNLRFLPYTKLFYYKHWTPAFPSGWHYVSTSFYKIFSNNTQQFIDFTSHPVGYSNVIIETNDSNKSGYTEYKFDHERDFASDAKISYTPINFQGAKRGNLIEEITYAKKETSFEVIQKRKYNYITGYNSIIYSIIITEWDLSREQNLNPTHDSGREIIIDKFKEEFLTNEYIAYTVAPFFKQLSNETIEKYYNGNITTTSTDYFYDNSDHNKVTRIETKNSTGQLVQTITKYPQDLTLPNTAEQKLIDQNRVALPIETKSFLDTNNNNTIEENTEIISNLKNNYFEWFPDFVELKTIESSKRSNPLDERIVFSSYDETNGKPKEVLKKDGTPITYIWGYNNQYPIAKIENATSSDITTAISTLNPAYNSLSELKELSDADNDHCLDSGSCNEKTLRTALNELRAKLPNAMTTTFTFNPLIGVTSATDPKGYTIYYEYDDFNRLKLTKDIDGKILSENNYNYITRPLGVEATISTPKFHVFIGDDIVFTTNVTGGSGNFSYKWVVSNGVINNEYITTTATLNLTTTNDHLPGFTVTCEVKDTSNSEVSTSSIPINSSLHLIINNITYSPLGTNDIGKIMNYEVNTSGGSGNFKYEWSKSVVNGSLSTYPEYESSSILFEQQITLSDCPAFLILCSVTDLNTGEKVTGSVPININNCN